MKEKTPLLHKFVYIVYLNIGQGYVNSLKPIATVRANVLWNDWCALSDVNMTAPRNEDGAHHTKFFRLCFCCNSPLFDIITSTN